VRGEHNHMLGAVFEQHGCEQRLICITLAAFFQPSDRRASYD
jgi:hypothetical protein